MEGGEGHGHRQSDRLGAWDSAACDAPLGACLARQQGFGFQGSGRSLGLSKTTWLSGVVVATVNTRVVVVGAELVLAECVVEVPGWLVAVAPVDDPIARKLEIIFWA